MESLRGGLPVDAGSTNNENVDKNKDDEEGAQRQRPEGLRCGGLGTRTSWSPSGGARPHNPREAAEEMRLAGVGEEVFASAQANWPDPITRERRPEGVSRKLQRVRKRYEALLSGQRRPMELAPVELEQPAESSSAAAAPEEEAARSPAATGEVPPPPPSAAGLPARRAAGAGPS